MEKNSENSFYKSVKKNELMMKKISWILAFSVFSITVTIAQGFESASPNTVGISTTRLDKIDAFINRYIENPSMPGGVFLIARKGKIAYFKSHGRKTLDQSTPYKNDDIFRIASMTKAVTTTAIMQLYENGMLGLDDPIHYYIPAFKEMKIVDTFNGADSSYTTIPAKKDITIRHLLTHTSGITYATFNPGKIHTIYEEFGMHEAGLFHHSWTTGEMVNRLAEVPLIFEPGTRYMYGLNMEVLGRIVEIVSEMELDEYFKQHIFDVVEMPDTYFHLPQEKHDRLVPIFSLDQSGKLIMMPSSGELNVNNYPTIEDNHHYAGGGGLSGTTLDYARFIQTLLDDLLYNRQKLLSRNTIELMTSDQLSILNKQGKGYSQLPGITYGLGFETKTKAVEAWSAKSAGTFEWGGYFNTKYFIDPEEELIFVGMTQIVPFYREDFWTRLYAMIYASVLE